MPRPVPPPVTATRAPEVRPASAPPAPPLPPPPALHRPIERLGRTEARQTVAEFSAYTNLLRARITELEHIVDRHGLRAFSEIDAYRERAEREMALERSRLHGDLLVQQRRLSDLQRETHRMQQQLTELDRQRGAALDAIELQGFGLFDYHHPADSSATLAQDLAQLRERIKRMVREKRAVSASASFTFNGSVSEGKTFLADMTKGLLRAYNAEAENAIKATKAGNLRSAQDRLRRAAEQITRCGRMIQLRVSDEYHELRLREIKLAAMHLAAVRREREMERERRAELREQQKAEAELRREQERLRKEQEHYRKTLAALEANGDEAGVERMRAQLEDVGRALEDVSNRSANVRAGYVYVISNLGAFGPDMVKIGMTRRLDPMDRVTELGDASVPFRFDVHALFFSTDAVGVEAWLHRRFAAERVNRVNLRREFFRVTPAEVLAALHEHEVEIVEFTTEPEAPEYRASLMAGAGAGEAEGTGA